MEMRSLLAMQPFECAADGVLTREYTTSYLDKRCWSTQYIQIYLLVQNQNQCIQSRELFPSGLRNMYSQVLYHTYTGIQAHSQTR